MLLSIDTTSNQRTTVKLGSTELTKTYPSPRSQQLLTAIRELLEKEGKTLKDITEVSVNPGPGTFTSVRIGVTVANALGFALGIPVNGKKLGREVVPEYGKPPNISQPKERS